MAFVQLVDLAGVPAMLAGLSASMEMMARMARLQAAWGPGFLAMPISPRASCVPARPPRSVRSTSGHLSTITIEHVRTADIGLG
jgi:hypothetical protein